MRARVMSDVSPGPCGQVGAIRPGVRPAGVRRPAGRTRDTAPPAPQVSVSPRHRRCPAPARVVAAHAVGKGSCPRIEGSFHPYGLKVRTAPEGVGRGTPTVAE
ncbi:hypothetical protein SALBM217S_07339 [Streptomyces griseoloalbus]